MNGPDLRPLVALALFGLVVGVAGAIAATAYLCCASARALGWL